MHTPTVVAIVPPMPRLTHYMYCIPVIVSTRTSIHSADPFPHSTLYTLHTCDVPSTRTGSTPLPHHPKHRSQICWCQYAHEWM